MRDFDDTAITVLWASIANVDIYFLSITPADADTNQNTFQGDDQLEFEFTGLQPGVEYTIQVVTGSESVTQKTFVTVQLTSKNIVSLFDTFNVAGMSRRHIPKIG